jgi:hypothetical protein
MGGQILTLMGLSERYSLQKQSERNQKLKQILAAVITFSEETLLRLRKPFNLVTT